MYTQENKSREDKSKSVVSSVAQKKSNGKQGFGFVDYRDESIMQRKVQNVIKNSHQNLQSIKSIASDSTSIQRFVKKTCKSGCGCSSCNSIQRVKIPDTHKHKDARRYAQERAYSNNPLISSKGRRVANCEGCGKSEYMERLQVDHMVPEAFLRQLHKILKAQHGKQRAINIAEELQLDWTKRDEMDSSATNEHYSTSMRKRYENYEVEKDKEFKGHLYEVLSDVDNLWMLCPECNGKREKTDKLLKVDYDALNKYYSNGGRARQSMMDTYLSKWIETDYFWDPSSVVPLLDIPNSPGQSDPMELEM